MAKINLLPWREKERERRNREFMIQLVAATLIAFLLAGAVWTFFNMRLENQNEANEVVKQANTGLDRKLKEIEELEKTKTDIVSRIKIIQGLQGKRPIPVHVFDTMVRTMPSNLYYSEISRKDNLLLLSGKANNPNTVSDLLRNIDQSEWLEKASVKKIISNNKVVSDEKSSGIDDSLPAEASYISFEMTAVISDRSVEKKESEITEKN